MCSINVVSHYSLVLLDLLRSIQLMQPVHLWTLGVIIPLRLYNVACEPGMSRVEELAPCSQYGSTGMMCGFRLVVYEQHMHEILLGYLRMRGTTRCSPISMVYSMQFLGHIMTQMFLRRYKTCLIVRSRIHIRSMNQTIYCSAWQMLCKLFIFWGGLDIDRLLTCLLAGRCWRQKKLISLAMKW